MASPPRCSRVDLCVLLLTWHRRSSYEPDAPARGVPQSPRWRVGLVCAKDAKLSCRGNTMALGQSQPRTLSLRLRIFLMPSPMSPSPARTGQGRGMEFLGFALLAILIIWVAATLVTQPLSARLPQVLGLGRGLGGTEMAAKAMESGARTGETSHVRQVCRGSSLSVVEPVGRLGRLRLDFGNYPHRGRLGPSVAYRRGSGLCRPRGTRGPDGHLDPSVGEHLWSDRSDGVDHDRSEQSAPVGVTTTTWPGGKLAAIDHLGPERLSQCPGT